VSFSLYIFTALALMLVIEGLVYALFPTQVKKMFEAAIMWPEKNFRVFGIVMVLSGFSLVVLLQTFSNG